MSGRSFAFLGADEFEEWHAPIDRWLLERSEGDGTVLIVPTAAAPEGDEVFRSWADKGLAHYARTGVPAEVLELRTREDALREDLAQRVAAASMVFFSGGNPGYLSSVLAGTSLWEVLTGRLDSGLAYAGCSAGVACLIDPTYDSDTDDFEKVWVPGLRFFADVVFAPHWDIVDGWIPGARAFITKSAGDRTLVGIDEGTAMYGDGVSWSVSGRGGVHVHRGGAWEDLGDGERFDLALT
jgi:cyanophycinase